MTNVYFIRHAEAEGNLYRRVHGWYDSLITDRGYLQIAALEKRFANIDIDAVYSSDLFRTMTTSGAVCKPKGLPLTTRKGLREVHMGVWEDDTWGEVARTYPEQLRFFNTTDPAWCAPQGESFASLRGRLIRAVRVIVGDHPDQTVAIFCHGTAIRNILAELQGISIADSAKMPHSDNTAVSLVEFDGDQVRVVFSDDASHLTSDISTFANQKWWKQDAGSLADSNFWYRPLDMVAEADFFRQCRAEAWLSIHGSWDYYNEDAFYEEALAQSKIDRRSVTCAMLGDQRAGLVQTDLARESEKRVGYIPFVYICPEFRGKGLGIQLIGQAVSMYRPMGREYLRLRCAPDNTVAQAFYKRHGFKKIAEAEGVRVPLDIMEKYIGYHGG